LLVLIAIIDLNWCALETDRYIGPLILSADIRLWKIGQYANPNFTI